MRSNASKRAAFSIVALIILLVFLLGLTLQKLDKAEKQRNVLASKLTLSEDSIVTKLVEIFTPIIKQEQEALQRGQTPPQRIETVIEKLKGIDPELIKEAVQKAYEEINQQPTVTSAPATTTTSTTTTSTTTTRPPPTTTTTRPVPSSTTSTTRPCVVNALGVVKVCLQ